MTTYIVTTTSELDRVPAPNLPLAPVQWDTRYQDQFANVLRLYFNRLEAALAKLTATVETNVGPTLTFPYGAFHQDGVTTLTANISNNSTAPIPVVSTAAFPSSGYILVESELIGYTSTTPTTFGGTITRGALGSGSQQSAHNSGVYASEVQGTGSSTTIGVVKLNATDFSNGVSISSTDPTRIIFGTAGTYNIQVSFQLANYTNSADNVTTWFRLNGSDIANTASIMTVPAAHGTAAGATILAYNVVMPVTANSYMQIGWTTDSGNSVIITYPPGVTPSHPSSPAVILTATFVSAPT